MLDTHALVERFEARGIKQWLLAREMAVHPRTVSRWLMGKVRRISRENLERLAAALACAPEDIAAPDGADVYATREEQRRAATLISESDLLHILSPTENWKLVERLIKATLEPDLPLYELGRLYNLLSIASWRQENFEEARRHAQRALEIAGQVGLNSVRLKAMFNIATIDSFEGHCVEALTGYEACIAEAQHFERERDFGSALANLSLTYRDFARFDEALETQERAMEIYRRLGQRFNLAISYTMYMLIYMELGLPKLALSALDESVEHSREIGFARSLVQQECYRAEIESMLGEHDSALQRLAGSLPQLRQFEGHDPEISESAARIFRRAGKLSEAAAKIAEGRQRTEPYPLLRGMLLQEEARLALARGDAKAEAALREEANAIFSAAGLSARLRHEPVVEYGEMFPELRRRVEKSYASSAKASSRLASRDVSANSKR